MRELIRILVAILGIFVISKTWSDYRAKKESWVMFLFWVIIWLVVIILAFFPSIIDYVLKTFGTSKDGIGTFLGIGIVLLLFISYRLYLKSERIERQITKLVQDLALRETLEEKVRTKK